MSILNLKESNSPYWLLGIVKGRLGTGSDYEKPCYYKSGKKQYEFAKRMINAKVNPSDEVYAITGIQWDNMKGSWSMKETVSYIKSKGELIASKFEITKYAEKYDNVEESTYPKGVSRDALPKDGAKVYTSPATALEGKGDEKMKLELIDEKIVKEELTSVDDIPAELQDRFFNTMADARPEAFEKYSKEELELFADFVKQLPEQEVTDLERSLLLFTIGKFHGNDFIHESINESTQDLIDKYEIDVDALKAEGYDLIVFRCKQCKDDLNEYNPYVYDDGTEIPLEKIKVIEVENHDDDCENSENNMHEKPQRMAPIQLWKYSKVEIVKESKIVTPVGNPQTASSFVNIDVDLDHMEVSDFIVRLAQAIRSEQTSVLEYVALRSANGITNEERANIDAIIEEEKNHMVAFTTMLYKQLLTNHKQNVDGANEEFTLPTFGTEIFDNSEDGKLTESIATTVEKLAIKEVGVRMSDEYFIGNEGDGRMYHGLGVAMDVIKNHISTSSEPLTIQNVSLTESAKLTEDNFSDFNEFLKEIGTDTNYDEIAYHIREYSKNDKAKALEMMDLLFDLENKNKTPKECINEIISTFGEKAEDVNITGYSETMSQEQYEIEVDVDYDIDFQGNVATNIVNAIHDMNPTTYANDKYAIAEDEGKTKLGDKLSFELLVYNGFNKEVNEEFIKSIVTRLLDKASTYEHYVTLK